MNTLADPQALAQELTENSNKTSSYQSKYFIPYIPELCYELKILGVKYASDAAIFLNQLRFWIKQEYGQVTKDGKRWIYNRYSQWVDEQIRNLSEWQFGKMVRQLTSLGIIEKCNYATMIKNLNSALIGWGKYKRDSWMTLNVDRLAELTGFRFDISTKESKPLPDKKVANTSLEDCTDNVSDLRSPQSSIFKETSIYTQDCTTEFTEKELENSQESKTELETDLWSEGEVLDEDLPPTTHYADLLEDNPSKDTTDTHEGDCSAAAGVGFEKEIKQALKPKIKADKESRKTTEIWEIAPGRPYSVFLNWWAERKYKPQGGRWEVDSRGNAYSEFYNNCDRTTVAIFPEFLEYMQQVAQNCNQQLSAGIKAILPSCFVQRPEANQENVQQLMVNIEELVNQGATVALPTNSVTPACTQSMSFDAAANSGTIAPLKEFIAIAASEPEPEVSADEELLRVLEIKQSAWVNIPALRDRIKQWVEKTDGVVLGENGPEIEE